MTPLSTKVPAEPGVNILNTSSLAKFSTELAMIKVGTPVDEMIRLPKELPFLLRVSVTLADGFTEVDAHTASLLMCICLGMLIADTVRPAGRLPSTWKAKSYLTSSGPAASVPTNVTANPCTDVVAVAATASAKI